jgi:hypothetical protein
VRQCQEILKQSPSRLSDDQARLKESYEKHLEQTKQKLSRALAEFSETGLGEMDELDSLVSAAAQMWLDFGTQRCRIYISMPGSNLRTQAERAEYARKGALMLTLAPMVERYGDSKGQDFSVVETLSDEDAENVARVGVRSRMRDESGAAGSDVSK